MNLLVFKLYNMLKDLFYGRFVILYNNLYEKVGL